MVWKGLFLCGLGLGECWFFTVSDLLLVGDKIDVIAVTTRLQNVGCVHLPYLLCCAFQTNFAQLLHNGIHGTFVPNELLLLPMK